MSAFHHKLIVDEFRQHGGTLTGPQIAAVAGFGWRRDLAEMLKLDYPLIESPTDLWHLDLEALPELDAGRAVEAAEDRGAWEGCGSSPDAKPDPQVEGEPLALPIDDERKQPASPYDPRVEAA